MIYLIQIEDNEVRVAKLDQGRLVDLDIERDNRLLGNIYKGRVENVLPGMDAAFINIGLSRNALIYVGDLALGADAENQIGKSLKTGDWLTVQIARPPVGNKGARVTQKLSLPGRYVVLMSGTDSIGVSRRIESNEERERLRRIAEHYRPLDHGIIVRTEADGVTESGLAKDVNELHYQFQQLAERARNLKECGLLHRELGLLGRLARDQLTQDVTQVIFDAEDEYTAFRDLIKIIAPEYVNRIFLHSPDSPIFDTLSVNEQIASTMERVVALPSGGYIIIDEAEALTAVDVNTGKFVGKKRLADTVVKTNLEAVEEVSRQLRLRNIGGVIVIDFIDMENTRDRIKVMNALENALKLDRTRTRIVQLSPLGLVEMTRRREGDSLRQLLFHACPYCEGEGVLKTPATIAIEARRRLREFASTSVQPAYQIVMHPEAAVALLGANADGLLSLEAAVGAPVSLRARNDFHREHVEVSAQPTPQQDRWQVHERLHLSLQEAELSLRIPSYTLISDTLFQLEQTDSTENAAIGKQNRLPAVIEVTAISRWVVEARVVVWQS